MGYCLGLEKGADRAPIHPRMQLVFRNNYHHLSGVVSRLVEHSMLSEHLV
jgi:hypothetical protein